MFANKTSAVVKARIGMKEVKATALPTCYCANLEEKKNAVRTTEKSKMFARSTVYKFHSQCQRNPFFPLAH
jgi:hypothetical protein